MLRVRFDGQDVTMDVPFTVGRDPACDLVGGDPRISREHLRVSPAPQGWTAADLGSTNGTFCDGERVANVTVDRRLVLRLGNSADGPALELEPAAIAGPRGQHTMIELPMARGKISIVNHLIDEVVPGPGADEPTTA